MKGLAQLRKELTVWESTIKQKTSEVGSGNLPERRLVYSFQRERDEEIIQDKIRRGLHKSQWIQEDWDEFWSNVEK